MSRIINETETFLRSKKSALKKYPNSAADIDAEIARLAENPEAGFVYPGISPEVRKIRFPLKAYRISAQGGLRLIYMYGPSVLIPIYLYKKGSPGKESDVQHNAKAQIAGVIKDLNAQ